VKTGLIGGVRHAGGGTRRIAAIADGAALVAEDDDAFQTESRCWPFNVAAWPGGMGVRVSAAERGKYGRDYGLHQHRRVKALTRTGRARRSSPRQGVRQPGPFQEVDVIEHFVNFRVRQSAIVQSHNPMIAPGGGGG